MHTANSIRTLKSVEIFKTTQTQIVINPLIVFISTLITYYQHKLQKHILQTMKDH